MHHHRGYFLTTKNQSKAQSAKLHNQLKKLKSLGLYSGDLRKKPGRTGKQTVARFSDVLSGKAVVLKPKDAQRFKGIYRTKGKLVVVPKRTGEKIKVDKSGEIISTRKVGNRTIKSTGTRLRKGEELARPKKANVQYAIPFNSRGGSTFWMRFPNYDELKKFMAGYNYKGWRDYVVKEEIGAELTAKQLAATLKKQRKAK